MEKKIMDKIDQVYDITKKRIDDVNSKFDTLFREFLTPEMIDMIKVIIDCRRDNYGYRFNNNKNFSVGKRFSEDNCISCFYHLGYNDNRSFKVRGIGQKDHTNTDNYIRYLEMIVEELNDKEEYYKLITANIKDIIDNITEEYRNISEKQSTTLDKILSDLGTDYTPTKHIKVTVEWVEEE